MEVNGNWLIIPYGTHTRYFDQDSGKYCLKFMPFGSMLTKSETMPATRFIKERVIHMAKVILGIILRLGPFGFDASPAFRGGLVEQDAINGFFTDYAHVSRKITQEEGYRRLRDRDENSDFLATSVAQLHLTTSDAQRDQLAELVLDELRHRDELKVIEYLVRPGSGYFVWPWNRWNISAPRVVIEDGGRAGSIVEYHNVGPMTQPSEAWNKKLQQTILMNKRSSKEHLLGTAIPNQVGRLIPGWGRVRSGRAFPLGWRASRRACARPPFVDRS